MWTTGPTLGKPVIECFRRCGCWRTVQGRGGGGESLPGVGAVHRGAQPGVFRSRGGGSRGGQSVTGDGWHRWAVGPVGPSGCGKSSLLNAAVVPLLEGDPAWLMVPRLVPGNDPVPELARVLAVTAHRVGLGWSASDVRGVLEGGTDGLRRVADDLLAASPATYQRLLVSIDQAEELFTRTTLDARRRFAHLLAQRSGPCHQPQSDAFPQVRRLGLTPFSVARPVFGLISGAPLTRNNSPVWGW